MSAGPTAPAADANGGLLVEAERLGRDYGSGATMVRALDGVDLQVRRGRLAVVHGRSGSGKTTLLNLISGLDRPTRGTVRFDGTDLAEVDEAALVRIRRHRIGFVFQTFALLPILSAQENVEVPLRLIRTPPPARTARAQALLELVGLGGRGRLRPDELSGGEQQRVAIARALANEPDLLIADEPTGQLDSRTAERIMTLLRALVASEGVTAVVATHDPVLLGVADEVLALRDGHLTPEGSST